MEIDSGTTITGLFGYAVKHSLSPLIHNYVYHQRNINSIYVCFQVPERDLKKATDSLRVLQFRGINVTIPYKESIIKFLDTLDNTAKLVGAVNTVKVRNNKLIGYNTDAQGFIRALKETCSFSPRKKRVVLCGCGGAGRAVSVSLCQEKIKKIQLFDIDSRRLKKLSGYLKRVFRVKIEIAQDMKDLHLDSCELFVNATPLGLKGELLPLSFKKLHKECVVYDLVYGKSATPLVKKCKMRKIRAFGGLSMLVYQAAISEKIWFGDIKDTSGLMFKVLKNVGYL